MRGEQGRRGARSASVLGALIVGLCYAAGVWVVLEAGVGVQLAGSLGERALVALLVATVFTVLTQFMIRLIHAPGAQVVLSGLGMAGTLLLAVPLTGELGRPLEVRGWWGLVLATIAIFTLGHYMGWVSRALLDGSAVRPALIGFGGLATAFAGLWLAQAVLADVRLSGAATEQIVTLVVLAAFFRLGGGNVVYPPLRHRMYNASPRIKRLYRAQDRWDRLRSVVVPFLVSGLKLWALCWLSGWMVATLRIDGFGPFLLATSIVTAVTAPVWLYEQRAHKNALIHEWLDRREQQRLATQREAWATAMWAHDVARAVNHVMEGRRQRP